MLWLAWGEGGVRRDVTVVWRAIYVTLMPCFLASEFPRTIFSSGFASNIFPLLATYKQPILVIKDTDQTVLLVDRTHGKRCLPANRRAFGPTPGKHRGHRIGGALLAVPGHRKWLSNPPTPHWLLCSRRRESTTSGEAICHHECDLRLADNFKLPHLTKMRLSQIS